MTTAPPASAEPNISPPRRRPARPLIVVAGVAVAVAVTVGVSAWWSPARALADADPGIHTRLAASHAALLDAVTTAEDTRQSAAVGGVLPDGTACPTPLAPDDPAVLALAEAVSPAQAHATIAAGLLDGSTRLGDPDTPTPAGTPWGMADAANLADLLDSDVETLTQSTATTGAACAEADRLAQAWDAWRQTADTAGQALADARTVLDGTAGQVADLTWLMVGGF
jgi:hypothetical protein